MEMLGQEHWERLRPEWAQLWARCPDATPFQAAGWLLPWASAYGGGRGRAVAVRVEGRLVAFLPMFSWKGALLLAGTGPSDYGDGLFLPGFEGLAGRMLAFLADEAEEDIRRIDLQQLRASSPLLAADAPGGWADEVEDGVVCPVAPLEGVNGMGAASPRWRKNWRAARRRVLREGGRMERVGEHHLTETVLALQHLHTARWQSRGEAGVLQDDNLRFLLEHSVRETAQEGIVRLYRLRMGDEIAAVLLTYRGHDYACYYISGFAPERGYLSPGTVLLGEAMAEAARDGLAEFHFLRGNEAYKYSCGARDTLPRRRVLSRL